MTKEAHVASLGTATTSSNSGFLACNVSVMLTSQFPLAHVQGVSGTYTLVASAALLACAAGKGAAL